MNNIGRTLRLLVPESDEFIAERTFGRQEIEVDKDAVAHRKNAEYNGKPPNQAHSLMDERCCRHYSRIDLML